MSKKQELELTWIGKGTRPKLEPRILPKDLSMNCHAARRVASADFRKVFTMQAHNSEMQAPNSSDRVLSWELGGVSCLLGGSSGELGKAIRLPKMRGEDHGKR